MGEQRCNEDVCVSTTAVLSQLLQANYAIQNTLSIVHPRTGKHFTVAKENTLNEMHAWFLKSSWKHFNSSGVEWLRNVSTL